jgi:carbamoyl-phosphate synthase large subunit
VKATILFTSAGRRVELLQSFRRDAEALGVALRVIACDLDSRWSAACQLADAAYDLPAWESEHYVDALLAICRRERVQLVVPTVDPELLPLALAAETFLADGCTVLVSKPPVVRMARDKMLTMDTLREWDLPVPRSGTIDDIRECSETWRFPVVAKPRDGSASNGLAIIHSVDELAALNAGRSWVVQEQLRGREFTVNMLFDTNGDLVVAVPHERRQVRAGEVEKGITVRHPGLLDCATRLAEVLQGARGALCFQAIVDEQGTTGIFEINARFGGGYPLTHAAGASFGRHLLAERLGLPLATPVDWREGVIMLRYDAAVFR